MKIADFITLYNDEDLCRAKFREYREKVGVVCPKCGCRTHYWIGGSTQAFECKECGCRQGLRSHTILHHSHISFRTWFLICFLMVMTKNDLSISEIQRQVGIRNFRTIFRHMHRIMLAMGEDLKNMKLSGECEIDEAFFKLPKETKQTRRSNEVKVVVAVESKLVMYPKKRYSQNYRMGRIAMRVVSQSSKVAVTQAILPYIDQNAVFRSDGTNVHNALKLVDKQILYTTQDVMRLLPFAHIQIGYMKDKIKATHHSLVIREYYQNYLDCFCWKKNNRYETDLFSKLVELCAGPHHIWQPVCHKDVKDLVPDCLKGIKMPG